MSQENVEVVRRAWEAWERRDMEALFALYDPAITWEQRGSPPVGLYHGHVGVGRFFGEWLEPFEAFYAHADEFIAAGNSVVVRLRQGGRGRGSGVEVAMPVVWQVYSIRDGRVIRVLGGLMDRSEALEAAGLRD
jgi:ketosteroid isomerase-like protein